MNVIERVQIWEGQIDIIRPDCYCFGEFGVSMKVWYVSETWFGMRGWIKGTIAGIVLVSS